MKCRNEFALNVAATAAAVSTFVIVVLYFNMYVEVCMFLVHMVEFKLKKDHYTLIINAEQECGIYHTQVQHARQVQPADTQAMQIATTCEDECISRRAKDA